MAKGDTHFDFWTEYCGEDIAGDADYKGGVHDGMGLHLVGLVTKFYPAVMHLKNGDPGYPAEGGEIEDLVITDDLGQVVSDFGDKFYASFDDEIYEHIADAEGDCAEDAADAKADAYMDARNSGDDNDHWI